MKINTGMVVGGAGDIKLYTVTHEYVSTLLHLLLDDGLYISE